MTFTSPHGLVVAQLVILESSVIPGLLCPVWGVETFARAGSLGPESSLPRTDDHASQPWQQHSSKEWGLVSTAKGPPDLCPPFSLGALLRSPPLLLPPLTALPGHDIQHHLLHELSFFPDKEKEIRYIQLTLIVGSSTPTSLWSLLSWIFGWGERKKAMMKKLTSL